MKMEIHRTTEENHMPRRNAYITIGVVAIAVTGTVLWGQGVFDVETKVPETLCGGYVEGDRVQGLMSSREGEFREDSRDFPKPTPPSRSATCEIRLGDDTVVVGTRYPSGGGAQRDEILENADRRVTWGNAFGRLKDEGSVLLYVPCPGKEDPDATVSVVTSADTANREYAPANTVDQATQDLVDLTAQVTRKLSQKHFKCKGANTLPKGTLRISPPLGHTS
ncbi:hypothetical protein [Streptomyces iconiensis]|uniref:Secreted protein n=1 Tax=Streptomyces iconiensis TaxID=1384038 RepID=A0ABT6ZZV0_9ACTN|nr:hypothetical protein [Streptomyces iconiensis]MDJ1134600.1 hypothetical protein [Streptomyces iconiensis]